MRVINPDATEEQLQDMARDPDYKEKVSEMV